ncbi:ER-golgi trafficking TRAPP I complex 85 kDa subunit-domain-containing protein [Pelagophyceae sp. CCMP2097]|nr:ER-golgi trafficking TRAPP I complex 85 kDa subunit-domain-containing protein [Pelagophyceae sp. CCMP2097]
MLDTRPVVCVACTGDAERLARKNGVSLCELLDAFAPPPRGTPVTFRSVARHSALPHGLPLRFVRARDMTATPVDVAESALHAAVSPRPGEAQPLDAFFEASMRPGPPLDETRPRAPWLVRWRAALEASLRHTEYDAFECPAVVVLVVSSAEPAGVRAALEELGSPHHAAAGFRDGRYDERAVPRHVLVLHDVAEKKADARAALAQAKQALASSAFSGAAPVGARLLPINSAETSADLIFAAEPPLDGFGALTAEDKAEIRRYNSELLHAGVIPALERRVASLHANVINSRKGVRNVLKSWLRRPKEADKAPAGRIFEPGAAYHFEAIESQIRLLADTCFSVRDYETALAMYRLARDDYKADKALLHLGAASEMVARSLHALAGFGAALDSPGNDAPPLEARIARRDAIAASDGATAALVVASEEARADASADGKGRAKGASRAARMLTRASLVAADSHTELVGPLDGARPKRPAAAAAADALVGAAQFETNLCAAVLYELAAWRFRAGGLPRKAALHLVMAGHRYRACGEEAHALECYLAARAAYAAAAARDATARPRAVGAAASQLPPPASLAARADDLFADDAQWQGPQWQGRLPGWARIDEHVEHALARQLDALGHHSWALRGTLALLGAAQPQATPDKHAALLGDLSKACNAHPAALADAAKAFAPATLRGATGGGETVDNVDAALRLLPASLRGAGDVVIVGLPLPTVVDDAVTLSTSDDSDLDGGDYAAPSATLDLAARLEAECRADEAWDGLDGDDLTQSCAAAVLEVQPSAGRAAPTAAAAATTAIIIAPKRLNGAAGASSTRAAKLEVWPRAVARAEAVDVDVVLRNNLAVPVELCDVHLVCTLAVGVDFAGRLMAPLDHGGLEGADFADGEDDVFLLELRALADAHDAASDSSDLDAHVSERVHMTLPPRVGGSGGSALVRLRCGAAAACGTLRVVGLRWRLGRDGPWGARAFERRGPKLRRTRNERATGARADDASLALHVVGDVPRLAARLVLLHEPAPPRFVAREASGGLAGAFDEEREPTVKKPWFSASAATVRRPAMTTLHGEVRHARLELANLGRAAAWRIRVGCSSAWLAVGCAEEAAEVPPPDIERTAVGASGLSWRASAGGADVCLAPATTVTLPVLLRAAGAGGKEPLRIVVQYSAAPAGGAPAAPPSCLVEPRCWPPLSDNDPEKDDVVQRAASRKKVTGGAAPRRAPLLRAYALSLEVCILPALTSACGGAALPRCGAAGGATLALALTNYRSDGPAAKRGLRVAAVRGLADDWRCAFATAANGAPAETVGADVGWQEQLAVHLRVEHRREVSAPAAPTAARQLAAVEHAASRFRAALRAVRLRALRAEADNSGGPRSVSSIRRDRAKEGGGLDAVEVSAAPRPVSLAALLHAHRASAALAVVVEWAVSPADDGAAPRQGQCHVFDVRVCAPAAVAGAPGAAQVGGPVALAVEHDAVVHFAFGGADVATARVVVTLANRAAAGTPPLAVRLRARDDARGDVAWLGATSKRVGPLAAQGAAATVELYAAFSRPGTFDLNLFEVAVIDGVGEGAPCTFDAQHLITVDDVAAARA